MNSNKPMFALLLLLVVGLIVSSSVFVVSETQRAVKLQFGKMADTNIAPGLHFRVPMYEEVKVFDARVQTLDSAPEDFLNAEKKPMTVDSYAKWRIIDVEKYYTSTSGDLRRAEQLLSQRISEGLRNEFALRTLEEVVASERDTMTENLKVELNKIGQGELGIEIIDVRVKKIELPAQVSDSIFNRMRAERERQAREYRSQGQEIAEGIRADADRQKVVIEANAYREAERLKGDGDAAAAAIYAKAYGQDPEFYRFWRSLDAYKETLSNKSDLLVIQPNSDFFDYLGNSKGKDN